MENKDIVIENAINEIEKRKTELAEKYKFDPDYKFKTNCRLYGTNIKTIGLDDLVKLYNQTNENISAYERTLLDIPWLKDEYKLHLDGFLPEDWKSDLANLINKVKYQGELKKYEQGKETLENLYSKDKQDSITITNLISQLLG